MFQRFYDRVKGYAASPYAVFILALLSLFESIFIPIPPDVLLILMAMAKRHQAFFYALVTTLFSVVGGVIGYGLGWCCSEWALTLIVDLELFEKYEIIQAWYDDWAWGVIFLAGFSPLPYKIFTLSAGIFQINFLPFVLASLVSRGLRFYMIATFIYYFGEKVEKVIYQYLNYLGWLVVIVSSLLYVVLST